MAKPGRIWLARHGQTVANREGRFCGHSETDLTDLGQRQAVALGQRLAELPLVAVYTSGLRRADATALHALRGRELALGVDPDLREIHYGAWEMARESDIRRSGDPQFRLMREEDPAWRPPGGETMADVRARTAAALGRIAQKHRHEEVLIVTHGTAIACMLAEVLQVAPTHTLRLETANCGLSCLVADRGRFSLALLNETSHLIGLGGHPQR